jgi:hypothetical protein
MVECKPVIFVSRGSYIVGKGEAGAIIEKLNFGK